ncbi:MAG: hypothetical protein J7578_23825 [Chitinophagaceae bacterium]|nr:hypothetical protein [Chitinophagaceae bacterium]
MLLSQIKQAGNFAANNSTNMKQSPRALLPGFFFPVIMLIIFSLSACKKGDSARAEGNRDPGEGTVYITNAAWSYPGGWTEKKEGENATYFSTKYTDIPAPRITDEIVQHGMVLVYFNPSDDESYTPLPYRLESIDHDYNFSFGYSKGNIRVHFYYSPNKRSKGMPSLATATVKDYTFKYVVVPGPASIKQQKDGIRLTRYETIPRYISENH